MPVSGARARRKMLHQALRASYDIPFDPGRDTLNPAASSTFVTCATRAHIRQTYVNEEDVCLARIKRASRESTRVLPRKTRGDAALKGAAGGAALLGGTLRFDG